MVLRVFAVAPAVAFAATDHAALWESFQTSYGKSYVGEEHDRRFQVFKSNVEFIDAENAKGNMYKLGINQLADLPPEEYRKRYLGFKRPKKDWGSLPRLGVHAYQGEALAESVDWSTQGAVTAVKNQGECGSCWAFSTTGSLEGAWQIANGQLVSLSEQQLVDCSKDNDGCDGGSMDAGFEYEQTTDACTESSYPYTAANGVCKPSGCAVGIPQGGVTGYKDVEVDSEQSLMSALQGRPVSVAIEADQVSFQLYDSGILTGSCGSDLDHGVLAVGYGTEGGTDYWRVKNSWGGSWGESGYVRIQRGHSPSGECGILGMSSYPVVDGSAPPGPAPTPTPTPPAPTPPAPSPSPSPADCVFPDTEEECVGNGGDGACTWCYFPELDFGICMDPGFDCGAARALALSARTAAVV